MLTWKDTAGVELARCQVHEGRLLFRHLGLGGRLKRPAELVRSKMITSRHLEDLPVLEYIIGVKDALQGAPPAARYRAGEY